MSFIIVFIIVYLFYFVTIILQKKKYEKFKKSNQIMYFVKKYKMNLEKINFQKFINIISLANSFIMAVSYVILISIDNFIIALLLALIVILLLTLILYHIIAVSFREGK